MVTGGVLSLLVAFEAPQPDQYSAIFTAAGVFGMAVIGAVVGLLKRSGDKQARSTGQDAAAADARLEHSYGQSPAVDVLSAELTAQRKRFDDQFKAQQAEFAKQLRERLAEQAAGYEVRIKELQDQLAEAERLLAHYRREAT